MYVMDSMISLTTVLNDSMGSTEVLVAVGVEVFLVTEEGIARMFSESGPKWFETVDLKSN